MCQPPGFLPAPCHGPVREGGRSFFPSLPNGSSLVETDLWVQILWHLDGQTKLREGDCLPGVTQSHGQVCLLPGSSHCLSSDTDIGGWSPSRARTEVTTGLPGGFSLFFEPGFLLSPTLSQDSLCFPYHPSATSHATDSSQVPPWPWPENPQGGHAVRAAKPHPKGGMFSTFFPGKPQRQPPRESA